MASRRPFPGKLAEWRGTIRNRDLSRLNLHHMNWVEAVFLRREMKYYIGHGIKLADRATVVDVGANVGFFSAYVHKLRPDVRIFAFEPLPPIFEVLERNLRERCGWQATALPYGLSSHEHELEFTYFPEFTSWSSSNRTPEILASEEKGFIARIDYLGRTGTGSMLKRFPAYLATRVTKWWYRKLQHTETYRVRVRPLSAVIDELGISSIDLLKIDVEGVEVDVLNGIEDRHWPMIQQVAVEVETWAERYPLVQEMLESKNFQVHPEQHRLFRASLDIGIIYAIRPATEVSAV